MDGAALGRGAADPDAGQHFLAREARVQVFIEDYFHDEGNKLAMLTLLNFYVIGAAAFGIFMVAKHAFAGVPA